MSLPLDTGVITLGITSECQHTGGVRGFDSSHVCLCVRPAGHPEDTRRPHACYCGTRWKDPA